VALLRGPSGGLNNYNLSSPREALFSIARIHADGDVRAILELDGLEHDFLPKELLRTLELRREVEHRGKKILFIAYEQRGIKKFDTRVFDRDADGRWLPSHLAPGDLERDHPGLAQQMRDWRERGVLPPEGGGKDWVPRDKDAGWDKDKVREKLDKVDLIDRRDWDKPRAGDKDADKDKGKDVKFADKPR
jgi:hypothetical protein